MAAPDECSTSSTDEVFDGFYKEVGIVLYSLVFFHATYDPCKRMREIELFLSYAHKGEGDRKT